MDETETTNLSLLSDMTTNLPGPVKVGLLKAVGELLGGLTAIPTAWLKRPAQAIDDTTAARSIVAATLAKGVAEQALADPVIMKAAADMYLPASVRKARNKVQVAQLAIAHVSAIEKDGPQAAAPDDDWMNTFTRFAEDASSEKLQDMFGRILAGEVVRPGSFTLSTLRTVAELDQLTAQDFSLAWTKSVGESVDYSVDFQRGEWFARWKRLAEAGLMAATNQVQHSPDFVPLPNGCSIWLPMLTHDARLVIYFTENCTVVWQCIMFTRTGCEIGSLLAPPDYAANMRMAAKNLCGQGISRVELFERNKQAEILYIAEAT